MTAEPWVEIPEITSCCRGCQKPKIRRDLRYTILGKDSYCEPCYREFIEKVSVDRLVPPQADAVSHPPHYKSVPGIECIDVVQHFNFNRGNVIKYVWRAGAKGDEVEDLKKARQYLDFEIARLEGR